MNVEPLSHSLVSAPLPILEAIILYELQKYRHPQRVGKATNVRMCV